MNSKVDKMLQNYKDDMLLDKIIESLQSAKPYNIKQIISGNKIALLEVNNKNSKKYDQALQILEGINCKYILGHLYETNKPVLPKRVNIFDNWIIEIENSELTLFIKSPTEQFSNGEQIYYGKLLISEYTKYVNECKKQNVIPSPFPNIYILNRTCKFITLENGTRIDNPNYIPIPEYKESTLFCCFS